jgi:4-amino-4-deoxy-L-arabinose transferase-like glycosyltransferase
VPAPHALRSPLVSIAVAGLLAGFAALSLWEMSGDSLTADERVHLPAGYAYWTAREFRLNPEHPPLIKLLCAIPLLPLRPAMPRTTPDAGRTWHAFQADFGARFLFANDAQRLLVLGRLPALLVGVLLLALLFSWSREMHGDSRAGLATLFLAALEPTLIAHSHFVADDVGLACFAVMALYFLWRFARTALIRDLALASLGMGMALATKYSALVLLPVFFALLLGRWPLGGPLLPGRPIVRIAPARLKITCVLGAAILIAVIVQASYLFSPDLALYLRGLEALRANRPPVNPAYVHGRFYRDMVPWYPIYAWLLKTPLPTLIAIAVGGILLRARRGRPTGALLYVAAPASLYTLLVCAYAYNYGVRYLIPTTSLLLVVAGGSVALLSRPRYGRAAGAVLALWLLASVLRAGPGFIGYFNEEIGGPANGAWYLQDSNLDWGQDLRRLAAWQRDHGIPEINLAYWGPGQPEYYGIRWQPWTLAAALDSPPPGVYAISVNLLVELKRRVILGGEDPRIDWLDRFAPSARVGTSIFIYTIP